MFTVLFKIFSLIQHHVVKVYEFPKIFFFRIILNFSRNDDCKTVLLHLTIYNLYVIYIFHRKIISLKSEISENY